MDIVEELKSRPLNEVLSDYRDGSTETLKAINWNTEEDMLDVFWDTGIKQFWTPDEFSPARDLSDWAKLTDDQRVTYEYILAGLTGLDTKQGGQGMPLISYHEPRPKAQANFSFMAGMEEIHAKSYSYIFTTLISQERTDYLLDKWVEEQEYLQVKAQVIGYFYRNLMKEDVTVFDRYMAKVASCFLESFLFYSGFYYPLLLAGQGKMTQSGGVIYKITQDEAYHGVVTGLTAQWDYDMLTKEEQELAIKLTYEMLDILYKNEVEYTKFLYDRLGLTEDVIRYVEFNANRALNNLGLDNHFKPEAFNPIVFNQVNTAKITNPDFFSTKPDYFLALEIHDIEDKDLVYNEDRDSNLVDEFI